MLASCHSATLITAPLLGRRLWRYPPRFIPLSSDTSQSSYHPPRILSPECTVSIHSTANQGSYKTRTRTVVLQYEACPWLHRTICYASYLHKRCIELKSHEDEACSPILRLTILPRGRFLLSLPWAFDIVAPHQEAISVSVHSHSPIMSPKSPHEEPDSVSRF